MGAVGIRIKQEDPSDESTDENHIFSGELIRQDLYENSFETEAQYCDDSNFDVGAIVTNVFRDDSVENAVDVVLPYVSEKLHSSEKPETQVHLRLSKDHTATCAGRYVSLPEKSNVEDDSVAQTSSLVEHNRTHIGEKPYKCTLCSKRFERSGHLIIHKRTHTGEKPYKCPSCPAEFASSGNLNQHQRSHTGEKPFKCTFCPSRFALRSTLRDHQRIHTGEKPYKCTSCPARFAQACNLREHKLIHTGEKPYKCTFCSASFTRRIGLLTHSVRVHNESKT